MAYSVPATHTLNKPIFQGLQVSSATRMHPLGFTVSGEDGSEFTYCIMESSDVLTYSGLPAVFVDSSDQWVVTPDASDGTGGKSAGAAGVGVGVFTMNNIDVNSCYLWVQTAGPVDTAMVSAVVVANDELIVTDENHFDDLTPFHNSATSTNWRIVAKALTAAAAGVTSLHSTANIILY